MGFHHFFVGLRFSSGASNWTLGAASQAERSEESKVENHGGSLQRWQGPYWWNSLLLGTAADVFCSDGEFS